VKEIQLTQGKVALVDDEDYHWLAQHKWYARRDGQTFYSLRKCGGRTILMHRELLHVPDGMEADHIDGDGLNNTKSNLRVATVAQNRHNARKYLVPTSSKYKGASWNKKAGKWRAYIWHSGKQIYLGFFEKEENAARAYNRNALLLFGEYAKLNKVGVMP